MQFISLFLDNAKSAEFWLKILMSAEGVFYMFYVFF